MVVFQDIAKWGSTMHRVGYLLTEGFQIMSMTDDFNWQNIC